MMRRERGAHHHVNVVILRAGGSSGNDGIPADKNVGRRVQGKCQIVIVNSCLFDSVSFSVYDDRKETSNCKIKLSNQLDYFSIYFVQKKRVEIYISNFKEEK